MTVSPKSAASAAGKEGGGIEIIAHPLVQHKLSWLRDRTLPRADFRKVVRELSLLLAYEATRDLPLRPQELVMPDGTHLQVEQLEGRSLCVIPILRAGLGLLEGMLDLVPSACVGHVGVQRDHDTLEARVYYFNVPAHLAERRCVVLDPMLATGHSALAVLDRLKKAGAQKIVFVCLVAAPEGVHALREAHPDVRIITSALDEGLDRRGYIVPGLGDAGDRLFGT
ncbi:uracil phosphoribosyltransferase [Oecophyllibacter saccharovorans]|uniref:Uracil phosphoribosyltransferase n=1 Tax=Oecophyllibacter saccharovorans TaxID=2558360 RepID=A0A506URD2_9PROT|nr:uracil phosphoribosyltransferase [Oecophyllibacter saccharovorans]TPW35904.1 uracil phosphoribosyltransferase [Oecophyllibacter saccharovorans]